MIRRQNNNIEKCGRDAFRSGIWYDVTRHTSQTQYHSTHTQKRKYMYFQTFTLKKKI